jgi:hypothetical protein
VCKEKKGLDTMPLILCALAGFSDFFMRDEIAEFIRSILFYPIEKKKGKG